MRSDVYEQGTRDPHDVLGVPRGADRQQVMRAFHRKARRGGHPDTGGDAQTFDEIIRARDVLLDQARHAVRQPAQRTARAGTRPASGYRPPPQPRRTGPPRESMSSGQARPSGQSVSSGAATSPRETSKLAIVMGALALLGPLFWPFAIIIGHLALRQIKRTGQGGGTVVPVMLLFLYVVTLPVLLRILSMVLIP